MTAATVGTPFPRAAKRLANRGERGWKRWVCVQNSNSEDVAAGVAKKAHLNFHGLPGRRTPNHRKIADKHLTVHPAIPTEVSPSSFTVLIAPETRHVCYARVPLLVALSGDTSSPCLENQLVIPSLFPIKRDSRRMKKGESMDFEVALGAEACVCGSSRGGRIYRYITTHEQNTRFSNGAQ